MECAVRNPTLEQTPWFILYVYQWQQQKQTPAKHEGDKPNEIAFSVPWPVAPTVASGCALLLGKANRMTPYLGSTCRVLVSIIEYRTNYYSHTSCVAVSKNSYSVRVN